MNEPANHGVVMWTNSEGTQVLIDVDALPTTAEPANVVMPNLHWDGQQARIITAANVLHIGPDMRFYRSTADPEAHVKTYVMCPGPYPCTGPHPHTLEQIGA